MDVTKTPYAEFLEMLVRNVVEMKPEQIAVTAVMPDGTAMTATYGDVGPYDLATMAFHMQADAIMDIVKANAKDIIEAAQDQEETEDAQ